MDELRPRDHQSQACHRPWSLTSNQPQHALHSFPSWRHRPSPIPSTSPMSRVFLGPLSSSQLIFIPALHLPAGTVCLKCKPDRVLSLHAVLPSHSPRLTSPFLLRRWLPASLVGAAGDHTTPQAAIQAPAMLALCSCPVGHTGSSLHAFVCGLLSASYVFPPNFLC